MELKRVGHPLKKKDLKQVTSYAIDAGCEWVLLTNTKEWQVYHVTFGQPPETTLVQEWNLFDDDLNELYNNFQCISQKSVKKGGLKNLWKKT